MPPRCARQGVRGQVVAQALAAAGCTIEAGRLPHSLHGYFLRAGDLSQAVGYEVERLRDGRSYCARRVTAYQDGRPIFTLSASFKSPEPTPERQQPMPEVPAPEDLPDPYARWAVNSPAEYDAAEFRRVVSMRIARPGPRTGDRTPPGVNERLVWMKATEHLPDDAMLHACAFVYASDLTLAPVAALDHEKARVEREGPARVLTASLDHSVWFHRPFRADDWLLFALRSPSGGDGRGLASGQVWTRDGTLVASLAQEVVVRPIRQPV
ncbi:acyl-CoA thioesterase II [Kitasatospora paranensis]|uniref:acyl-CoA thioesterase n=1 Tax=Kitasatospora paranensis TaxID=258053 RepID=UPI0031E53A51